MSLPRLPAAMSRFSLSARACSVLTSEKQWVVQPLRFSAFIRSSNICCSCSTQQKITFSNSEQARKPLSRWAMLLFTIAFVSSVTTNGCISQHQSPSRNTFLGRIFCSSRHVAVLPPPIVPPTIMRLFICCLSHKQLPPAAGGQPRRDRREQGRRQQPGRDQGGRRGRGELAGLH